MYIDIYVYYTHISIKSNSIYDDEIEPKSYELSRNPPSSVPSPCSFQVPESLLVCFKFGKNQKEKQMTKLITYHYYT